MDKTSHHTAVGILAHVDAGKTTLAEGILYQCGNIREQGRVDYGNAFLDNFALERARGITIFAKQARITLGDKEITLMDTPGHVDFGAEMERTLQILDYAVLVISGSEGIQGHVLTLWQLLKRYEIPVFLFVNKMDLAGADKAALLAEVKKRLDERCVDFTEAESKSDSFWESLAMCEEGLMEQYLEEGSLSAQEIGKAISDRCVFPVFFGSALKLSGVKELLQGLERYMGCPLYGEAFGARVYKISRDAQGTRLTHLKITGGSLRVKQAVTGCYRGRDEESEKWEEKIDQIRLYSGTQYELAEQVTAGMTCVVTGLSQTYSGQGLGTEAALELPVLEPVLTYRIELPEGSDVHKALAALRQLEEEVPELHVEWEEESAEIHAQIMGQVQMEILQSILTERFGMEVSFGEGSIVYKETITEPVIGIGHFEPLRHYAEVHLLLEPGEPGSGLQIDSACSEDVLDRNWQRLIQGHLEERKFPGVLAGAEITDMKVTLLAGRAHVKHTEGGDFRQAAYRALRQGLMKAKAALLEPVYEFQLEVPTECIGRAMTDIKRMHGTFETPEMEGERVLLTGTAPVFTMSHYQKEVTAYTRGVGRFSCILKGYEPCHNAEEVIAAAGYVAEQDAGNPAGSVFCTHGAGYPVEWQQVDEMAHVDASAYPAFMKNWREYTGDREYGSEKNENRSGGRLRDGRDCRDGYAEAKELEEIFNRTFGKREGTEVNPYRRKKAAARRTMDFSAADASAKPKRFREPKEEYLLVDGYNIIFAWEELRNLAQINIDGARDRLMDILCNYQGYLKNTLILVFDAYKVKGNPGSVVKYHNIYVVYTKEAETADQYIEKTVHEIGRKYHVTVATSDALEQMIIWGEGAARMSARGLLEAVETVNRQQQEAFQEQNEKKGNYPFRSKL